MGGWIFMQNSKGAFHPKFALMILYCISQGCLSRVSFIITSFHAALKFELQCREKPWVKTQRELAFCYSFVFISIFIRRPCAETCSAQTQRERDPWCSLHFDWLDRSTCSCVRSPGDSFDLRVFRRQMVVYSDRKSSFFLFSVCFKF